MQCRITLVLTVVYVMLRLAQAHLGEDHNHDAASIDDIQIHTQSSASNYTLAFGLTIAAGLSTSIGGAAVFLKTLPSLSATEIQAPHSIACGLGITSGVLVYGALAKLLPEAKNEFSKDLESAASEFAVIGSFLMGAIVIATVNCVTHRLNNRRHTTSDGERKDSLAMIPDNKTVPVQPVNKESVNEDENTKETIIVVTDEKQMKNEVLRKTTITALLAISLHNIPEGIVTFTGTLADPALGIGLALAIALHNIPEGFTIACPVYLKTGSKWRGFWVATIVGGLSEPLGAIIGYMVIEWGGVTSGSTYGVLYASTSGIMCYLVVCGTIPLANRFDPSNRYTPFAFFVGVGVMALSFAIALL